MNMKRRSEYPMIAGKMKRLREHLGYNPNEMAGRIGTTAGAYRKYESGERSPSFRILARMVKEFNISMDWLYFNKGSMFFEGEKEKTVLQQQNHQLQEQLQQLQAQMEESRQKTEYLTGELKDKEIQLNHKQQQLDGFPDMSPEVRELAEHMSQNRLLNHEILAHFLRFESGTKE